MLIFGVLAKSLPTCQQDQICVDLFLISSAEVAGALFNVESNHRIGKAAPVLELRNVSFIEHDGSRGR